MLPSSGKPISNFAQFLRELGGYVVDRYSYILSKFPDVEPNSSGEVHANCPFHDDTTKSFSISVASGREGVFVCGSIACGVRGNFPLFFKMSENLTSWKEVYDRIKVSRIATDVEDLFATKPREGKKYEISQFPSAPYAQVEHIINIDYLNDRGLGKDVVDTYGLLYGRGGIAQNISVHDAIILPVYDVDGTYLTFQVRYLSPGAKLRWRTPSSSPIQLLLYGGWIVPWGATSDLWIVEGASDVWNLYAQGIQSVGIFTKDASDGQLNRLVKLCVDFGLRPVVCLDGDTVLPFVDYGQKIQHELQAYGLDAKLVHLEKSEDPGGLSPARLASIRQELESRSAE